jgi:hypothetical protein
MDDPRNTVPVSDAVFAEVYDSPASLPGRERWLTSTEDVHRVEALLGMDRGTVQCADCGAAIETLRSFKCHNWAHAVEDMADVLRQVQRSSR